MCLVVVVDHSLRAGSTQNLILTEVSLKFNTIHKSSEFFLCEEIDINNMKAMSEHTKFVYDCLRKFTVGHKA